MGLNFFFVQPECQTSTIVIITLYKYSMRDLFHDDYYCNIRQWISAPFYISSS